MKAKKLIITFCIIAMVAVMAVGMMACSPKSSGKVKVIEIKLTEEEYAFGVNKKDPKLLADVNAIIADMQKKDGEMDKIMNKYFNGAAVTPIESAKEDSAKDQLVVSTNASFAPFEDVVGNKFVGIDMEIAQYIAKKLNKELVIKNMDFEAAILDVGAGTSDIVMAGLTVNEDRKKSVAFTTSYYKASQMVVVKEEDTSFDACKTVADVEKVLSELKGKKAGFQFGTTSQYYVEGNAEWEFKGFANITANRYENAGLAITDMLNGNIDLVIVDELPAYALAKKFQ
ncbi:MAG: transporter substrate-binding domain-containing protein [Clostridia bacterium]